MPEKILIALAVIIAVFLIAVAVQLSEFQVERSATMSAPSRGSLIRSTTFISGTHGRLGAGSTPTRARTNS